MEESLITQKYTVIVLGKEGLPVKQIYTDKLSEDGKSIHTYRPDGTLCLKKEFDKKGEYTITKYDSAGEKVEYHVRGGKPDERTERLFRLGEVAKKEKPAPSKFLMMRKKQWEK